MIVGRDRHVSGTKGLVASRETDPLSDPLWSERLATAAALLEVCVDVRGQGRHGLGVPLEVARDVLERYREFAGERASVAFGPLTSLERSQIVEACALLNQVERRLRTAALYRRASLGELDMADFGE